MTHIRITKNGTQPARVEIDGVDWSRTILARNFEVNIPEEFYERATVTMEVPADLEIDLPDAALVVREASQ